MERYTKNQAFELLLNSALRKLKDVCSRKKRDWQKIEALNKLEKLILEIKLLPEDIYLEPLSQEVQKSFLAYRAYFNGRPLRKDFIECIERLREEKGVSRKTLCKETGIEPRVYSRYINKKVKKPNFTTLVDIAEYFRVSIETFYE